jgi:uncharacterized membrane protein
VRTRRGLDRVITFVDAVVAIAITLLVLPLVDVLAGEAAHRDLLDVMADNAGRLGAFLLSFVVIARFWLGHHHIVECVETYDPAFVMVNFAWMLTIVFLPFATQVAAVYGGHQRLAVATYIGTVTASSLCLSVLAVLVSRRPGLRRPGLPARALAPAPAVLSTLLLLCALVVGVAVPRVSFWALLLLLLSGPLDRLRRSRSAGPGVDPPTPVTR